MCANILNNKQCPYGSRCNFAHSQSELRKAPCAFQKNCKNKNCQYSHDDEEELKKVVNEVETKLQKIAIYEKDCKDLIIPIEEDDAKEAIDITNKRIEEAIKYEDKYYDDVRINIAEDDEAAYKYMEEYDRQIKTINNYNINITMDEYAFKKLMFYLTSTGCEFNVEKK